MRHLIATAIALALLGAAPAFAQDGDLHFTENASNGWCHARVWGGKAPGSEQRMVLELSYRADDGSLGVTIHVAEWQRVRDADPDRTVPMTLTLDATPSPASSEGGYESPYDDEVWGSWAPQASAGIVMRLKTARSAHVLFDGLDLPFALPPAGRMYDSLTACAARLRAAKP